MITICFPSKWHKYLSEWKVEAITQLPVKPKFVHRHHLTPPKCLFDRKLFPWMIKQQHAQARMKPAVQDCTLSYNVCLLRSKCHIATNRAKLQATTIHNWGLVLSPSCSRLNLFRTVNFNTENSKPTTLPVSVSITPWPELLLLFNYLPKGSFKLGSEKQ